MLLEEFKEILNIAEAGLFEKFETAFYLVEDRLPETLSDLVSQHNDVAFILQSAFPWKSTKEGLTYWLDLYNFFLG